MTTPAVTAEVHFRTAMKTQRAALGISQQALSDILAEQGIIIDSSGITRIEGGSRRVRLGEAVAIAKILEFQIHSGGKDGSSAIAATRVRRMADQLRDLADVLSAR